MWILHIYIYTFFFTINQQVYSNSQLSFENLPLNGNKWRKEEWEKQQSHFFHRLTDSRETPRSGYRWERTGKEMSGLRVQMARPACRMTALTAQHSAGATADTHTHTQTHSYILNACRVHWNTDKHVSTHQQLNRLPLWQRPHSHCGSLSARWWKWAKE